MKGRAGRPRIPLSNISNRKGDGLTGSPSPAPAGEGDAQLSTGGEAKKKLSAHGKGVKKRSDKKSRLSKFHKADGGKIPSQKTDGEPDDSPIPKGKSDYDHEDDMEPQGKASGGWIKGAIKHPGAEKKAAAKAGMSTHDYMEKHKHDSGKSGARARLGLTLSGMVKRKK